MTIPFLLDVGYLMDVKRGQKSSFPSVIASYGVPGVPSKHGDSFLDSTGETFSMQKEGNRFPLSHLFFRCFE